MIKPPFHTQTYFDYEVTKTLKPVLARIRKEQRTFAEQVENLTPIFGPLGATTIAELLFYAARLEEQLEQARQEGKVVA